MESIITTIYGKESVLFIKETFGKNAKILSQGFCDLLKEEYVRVELKFKGIEDAFYQGRIFEQNIK